MQVLFSADWHIKLGQKNVPKDWQINRFHKLYEELWGLETEVDIHIIGGDIFDKVPKLEELILFIEFLQYVSVPTYIFDGNHEATKKGHSIFEVLKPLLERVNRHVKVIIGPSTIEDCIDVLPYTEIKRFKPEDFSNNILVTHVRGEIPPHVKAEIDLDKLNRWDIVFAGDLHSHSNSQRNIVYPGSPVTTSFHRKEAKTGVIIFDTENVKEYSWIELDLPQLIRKTVDSEEDMVKTEYHHTVYELSGDISSLSKVKNTELLDKKIVSREVDSTLKFSKSMSHTEELKLFLELVLQLNEKDIARIADLFNDLFGAYT